MWLAGTEFSFGGLRLQLGSGSLPVTESTTKVKERLRHPTITAMDLRRGLPFGSDGLTRCLRRDGGRWWSMDEGERAKPCGLQFSLHAKTSSDGLVHADADANA